MARQPEDLPVLDRTPLSVVDDLEVASIRHLQRADQYLHALMTKWGGAGQWIHDPGTTFLLRARSGSEYVLLVCLVSGGAEVEFDSGVGDPVSLSWEDNHGGATDLAAAELVAADGGSTDGGGPLRLRNGALFTWTSSLEVTITAVSGSGKIHGILAVPLFAPL